MIRTMIVDDERLARQEIKRLLESFSEIEVIAESGVVDEALDIIEKEKPDLLLLDIQMPGKNGFELMTKIRGHNPSIIGIYMTGDPDRFLPRLKEEQNRHQVDFICKPFSLSELSMVLSKLQD